MEGKKMVVSVLTMTILFQVVMGVDHPVGGTSGGWDTLTDLSTWDSAQSFAPGDSLTFTYQKSHDVVEVSKADYDTCSGSNPIASYTGGSTTIKLLTPGNRYFICSVPGHCNAGMKLAVDVGPTADTLAPSPSVADPTISPSSSPDLAPSDSSATTIVSDLPAVSAPTPSQIPTSGAVGSARWVRVAFGLGLACLVVLNF